MKDVDERSKTMPIILKDDHKIKNYRNKVRRLSCLNIQIVKIKLDCHHV